MQKTSSDSTQWELLYEYFFYESFFKKFMFHACFMFIWGWKGDNNFLGKKLVRDDL